MNAVGLSQTDSFEMFAFDMFIDDPEAVSDLNNTFRLVSFPIGKQKKGNI